MLSSCLSLRSSRLATLTQPISQHALSVHIPSHTKYISTTTSCRLADSTEDTSSKNHENTSRTKEPPAKSKSKSIAQADQELRERLEQMSGDGGASGIEYEDGKPTAMKRSVRNNMFRYI
ncbi:uncharacterized protein BP01DRAFT_393031 [Aspergillus saccharolyticus JOP 1030-1]|uniref:Uncharacterized protein n=1 Tax=Aspergillus saccharolyticus JOP 1030-1 TaxID=1450539 RepID=A0A318ZHA2_9EURO|nr:hypothetical protein BP01DRAFT_393031 [Aspergillus saccharolyticus JOP 1030-1]PYH43953.1 hypothetical protein BP01DRAFT_393031 [Aspergillus saccharolyticus JOP 1030-1]